MMRTDLAWTGETGPGFDRVLVIGKEIAIVTGEAGARKTRGEKVLETGDRKIMKRCAEKQLVSWITPKAGIDDAAAKAMAENKVGYLLLFRNLLRSRDQAAELGSIIRDVTLCRKRGAEVRIASGARAKDELRSAEVLVSLLECLGIDRKAAKEAVE